MLKPWEDLKASDRALLVRCRRTFGRKGETMTFQAVVRTILRRYCKAPARRESAAERAEALINEMGSAWDGGGGDP